MTCCLQIFFAGHALMMEQGVFGQPVSVRNNAGSSAVKGSSRVS
jgi:hypothetical protein